MTEEDLLRNGVCSCVGMVESYSFATAVVMREPGGGLVNIDVCIATEIGRLWMNGVETIECCCGHGSHYPSVFVAESSVKKMEELGYQHYEDLDPSRAFILSGKLLPIKADNPVAEGWKTRGGDRTANNPDEAEILRYMREVDEDQLHGHAFYIGDEGEESSMKWPTLYELKRRGRIVLASGGFAALPKGMRLGANGTLETE